MTVPVHPAPDLRDRLVTALSMAGAYCGDCNFEPGDIGCSDCQRCHRMYVDAVLAIVQPELDQWEQQVDAEKLTSAVIFSTYYKRWQGTIVEARRQAARADKATARGDIWKAKAIAIEQDRDQLLAQLAAVRAYAEDLYTAPQKVSACGVRERLLDILTPTGPTLTIAEAMAKPPITPRPCCRQVEHDPHTWPAGHPAYQCGGDLTYTKPPS